MKRWFWRDIGQAMTEAIRASVRWTPSYRWYAYGPATAERWPNDGKTR